MRAIWLALGLGAVVLGFIGIFVPVLPTTPFLILAAACFARSSPRLEGWLLDHPRFGPPLRDWRERGAVSRKGKVATLAGTAAGFVAFWIASKPGPLLAVSVA